LGTFEKILVSFSREPRCDFKQAQERDSIKDEVLLEVNLTSIIDAKHIQICLKEH
jgi:hypothetical protein